MAFSWMLIMGLVYGLLIIIVAGLMVSRFAKGFGFRRKAGRKKGDDTDNSPGRAGQVGQDGEDRGI